MARWSIIRDGRAIAWDVKKGDVHTDDVEMAGFYAADTVTYGMTEDGFKLMHRPTFPTLRLRPNNTHATYQLNVPDANVPKVVVNGEIAEEVLTRVEQNGILTLYCTDEKHGLEIVHTCYPSTDWRITYEAVTVRNTGDCDVDLTVTVGDNEVNQTMGPMGINIMDVITDFEDGKLKAGEEYTYYILFTGRVANEDPDCCLPDYTDPETELRNRVGNIERLTSPMKLDTGNELLDTMFRFAKIRAGESVFDTMYGLLHSPGGKSYYAATWCNDQVEYAGPYFAYTGDEALIECSANAYRMYMPFMSSTYQPIPSSVIAEGIDYWNGAGDRGDAAMYLYGASRFVLTTGDRALAEELLAGIEWCAEYCWRKKNEDGVIASDSDELEGRFPAGDANLCTSTLAYAGYLAAAALEKELGDTELAETYESRAKELRDAIETHFGADIHGIPTYRYYKECEIMRSWICMPLCVGIYNRARATVDALTSEYLMKPDGFLTAEGSVTIWDRYTLYALRGIFASGYTDEATKLLLQYSENRLLGERVPYAVEAYPEGGRRHLSGESALFCKVITEGLLDMKPTGLNSFSLKPTLPDALDHLFLTDIRAHGIVFDVKLEKDGYTVTRNDGTVLASGKNGEYVEVNA